MHLAMHSTCRAPFIPPPFCFVVFCVGIFFVESISMSHSIGRTAGSVLRSLVHPPTHRSIYIYIYKLTYARTHDSPDLQIYIADAYTIRYGVMQMDQVILFVG